MSFFEAFPAIAAEQTPFATAMANLECHIPACQNEVDASRATLMMNPDDADRRADLNVAAQKLARRQKSSADLIALYLQQTLGTPAAPDATTTFKLMTYHDRALREAFQAKCEAFRATLDDNNNRLRTEHLRDIYNRRLYLGGTVDDGTVDPRLPSPPPTVSTAYTAHVA